MSNTYTQEQIDGMSRFEVNKAVAEKIGFGCDDVYPCSDGSIAVTDPSATSGFEYVVNKNYASDPSDYMPIAVKHAISINYWGLEHKRLVDCWAIDEYSQTKRYPATDTGLAVCAAFLMMEVGE